MSWFSRLMHALNPRCLDDELAEEMSDHLERRASQLAREGLGVGEARQKARLRFGNATRLREESRGVRLWTGLEGTLQDIRYAWRGMRKAPAFAATAVVSLALAIGANTAIYSIVDAAILRPLPVREPDQLFVVSWPDISDAGAPSGQERYSFSYPEFVRFQAVTQSAARLALFSSGDMLVEAQRSSHAPLEKIDRQFVSGEAFDILGVQPALGRLFSTEEDHIPARAVAVLSYDYWLRRFHANPAVIGRNLRIAGNAYEVIGVARKGFSGVEPGRFVDVWLPGTLYERRALSTLGWHWFRILGRYAPGVSPEQIQAHLQPSFHDLQAKKIKQFTTMPPAIRKQFVESPIHVHSAATGVSDFRKTFSRPLWIVFSVAAGILLIACANVASLLLARATARAMEMAMRISLGAARIRLVRQVLTECLMLSLLAGAVACLVARVTAPLLVTALSTAENPVRFALAIDSRVLLFCTAVSTLAALSFGLVPALQGSGIQPINALRSSTGQAGKLRLGKFFVTVQVACAFCLVMVGASFLFSLANLFRVNPGFDARNVAVLGIITEKRDRSGDAVEWSATHPGEIKPLRNLMFRLQNDVASQPGIQSAALAWWPILEGGGWSQQVIIPGKGPSQQEEIFYRVSPGYFQTLRTPFLAGRDFEARDTDARDPAPAIVNLAFARKYFNSIDVLGRDFSYPFLNSPVRERIVGVVADAQYYDLRKSPDPIVYLPMEGNAGFTLYVRSVLSLGTLVRAVDREGRAVGSGTRVREVTTLETLVGNTLLREKLLAGIGGAFAFFGLLLAAIGLFGLLSYSVGRRTKEIGIRAALGAQRFEIIGLVLRDMGVLLGGGLAVGLAAALAIMTVFRSLLFGIQKVDPVVIPTAIALFLVTSVLAAGLPARRAATVDPISALREE
jgi:predicted permease